MEIQEQIEELLNATVYTQDKIKQLEKRIKELESTINILKNTIKNLKQGD